MDKKMNLMKTAVKISTTTILIIVLLFQNAVLSSAQNIKSEDTVLLDPIIISAKRSESTISNTPGSVGIIGSEKIEKKNLSSISDITRAVPGVEKSSDSSWGSGINIRGLGQNRILALADGIRINTAADLNGQFGLFNPYDIEKVEILKGPLSSLYGSGSIGGVVNIISKKGRFTQETEKHGTFINSYSNNPEGFGTYFNTSYNSNKYWLFTSGSYRDYGNRYAANDNEILNSQYRDKSINLSSAYLWNESNSTELDIENFKGENIGITGKGSSTLPDFVDVTYPEAARSLYSITHKINPSSSSLKESEFKIYSQKIERRVRIDRPNASVEKIEPQADHYTKGFLWTNNFIEGGQEIIAGIDLWSWEIDNTNRYITTKTGAAGIDSSVGDVSQNNYGLFIDDTFELLDNLTFNAGARLDCIKSKSDDLYAWIEPLPNQKGEPPLKRDGSRQTDISWQLNSGFSWEFKKNWSANLLAASSYRTPDLMDRFKYINLGGGVELYGNPDIEPERSYFTECDIHYISEKIFSSFAAYANFLTDMISEQKVTEIERRMANIDKAEILGSEFELRYRINSNIYTGFNIAYSKGKNRTSEEPLPFIPPFNGSAYITYQDNSKSGLWIETELDWAAAQTDVPLGFEESELWHTVNICIGYNFVFMGSKNSVLFNLDNMFDKDYKNYLSTSRGIELKEPGISISCIWKVEI